MSSSPIQRIQVASQEGSVRRSRFETWPQAAWTMTVGRSARQYGWKIWETRAWFLPDEIMQDNLEKAPVGCVIYEAYIQ